MHTEVKVTFLHGRSHKKATKNTQKTHNCMFTYIARILQKINGTNLIKAAKPFSYMITMRACMYFQMTYGALSAAAFRTTVLSNLPCWQDEKCLTGGKLVLVGGI